MTPAPKRRPSSSMVVAIMALVVALAGTATAAGVPAQVAKVIKGSKIKRHSVAGNRLKNNTLTGKQIRESKLKIVPKSKHALTADDATNADNATTADTATNATNADNATTADTATNLAPPEALHEVTAFKNGCASGASIVPFYEAPAYFKDKGGVVHLQGVVTCPAANNAAFALPEGYRPATGKIALFHGLAASSLIYVAGTSPNVPPLTDGDVYLSSTGETLDGITFRAAS